MTATPATTGYGLALRALRSAAGMTLDEVADAAGVSVSYLSRVENGVKVPSDGWVALVAVAIGDRLATAA